MTEAEKRELEALKAKSDLTEDEKARLAALEAKAKEGEGDDESFSKAYVEQLRKENAKYRTRAKEADEKLAGYDGIDPAKYREMEDAAKKAEEGKLKSEGEWDKLRQNMVTAHEGELRKKDDVITQQDNKIKQLEAEIGKTILSHEIAVEASVAEAINPKLVEMVVEQKTKIEVDENGNRVITVLDTEGNPAIDLKTGKPQTIAGLLKEMKGSTEYAHLFKGGSTGAGSGTESFGGKSIKNPWKADSRNLTLQGQIVSENPDQARRLISEAGLDPKKYQL